MLMLTRGKRVSLMPFEQAVGAKKGNAGNMWWDRTIQGATCGGRGQYRGQHVGNRPLPVGHNCCPQWLPTAIEALLVAVRAKYIMSQLANTAQYTGQQVKMSGQWVKQA